jgi:two-component system, chemotaxis family, response regulator Rcp1
MPPASNPVIILLVEDNPADIELTLHGLKRAKLQNRVHIARDGAEAIAFLRKEPPHQDAPRPDLVLLDLNLPKIDGRGVLQQVRADASLRDLPIVVLTVSDSEQERFAVGLADAFLRKPVDFAQLTRLVQMVAELGWSIVKVSRESARA